MDVRDFLFMISGLLTMYNFSFSPYFCAKKKKKTVDKTRARKNTKGKPMASLAPL